MILIFILLSVVLICFVAEKKINDRCLSSFLHVIHVNGIRGKTSTSRLIDAALRANYKVFTKTTGTDAAMLHVDGTETPVPRLGPANIHEQLRMIRKARREGAQILILECMAVKPELQKVAQELIVKSDISVITNVRYDHVFEMGETLDEIASSLAATVPHNGILFSADANYAEFFREKCKCRGSRFLLCTPAKGEDENGAIARALAIHLGIGADDYENSKAQVREDFGVRSLYTSENSRGEAIYFYNLFSANDPDSSRKNLDEISGRYKEIYFTYNHRGDRPDRALLFARYFFPHYPGRTAFLMGNGSLLAKRIFKHCGLGALIKVSDWRTCLDIPAGSLLVGLGNIKGPGYQMIEEMELQRRGL